MLACVQVSIAPRSADDRNTRTPRLRPGPTDWPTPMRASGYDGDTQRHYRGCAVAVTRAVRHLVYVLMLLTASVSESLAQSSRLPAVFTAAQAARGKDVYAAECAACHGGRLSDGNAVALSGRTFLQKWSHPLVTLDDLFYIVQTTMPKNRGNALPLADYVAVTAYILEANGYPAGAQSKLASADQRKTVRFTESRSAGAPEFIPGPGGMRPTTIAPDQSEFNAAATNAGAWLYHTNNYAGTRFSPQRDYPGERGESASGVCVPGWRSVEFSNRSSSLRRCDVRDDGSRDGGDRCDHLR